MEKKKKKGYNFESSFESNEYGTCIKYINHTINTNTIIKMHIPFTHFNLIIITIDFHKS